MATIYKQKSKTKTQTGGQLINLTINSTDYEVNGVAQHQQKIVFVSGALAGEQVQAKVQESKAGFIKAQVIKLIKASPQRITPFCAFFDQCGGCQLQYLPVATQRQLKQQGIDELIRHQTGLTNLPWQPMLTSAEWHYRRRARIGIWYDKKQRQFTVGFRKAADKQLTDIEQCRVLSPALAPVFSVFRQHLPLLSQAATAITHVEVVDAAGTAFVIVRHMQALTEKDRQQLIAAWPQAVWLGAPQSGTFEYWQQPVIPCYSLGIPAVTLQFDADAFIQVNAQANEQMVAQAIDWLAPKPSDTILDLYSGIGNFTLPLAQRAKKVQAVEGVAKMVQQLATNAKLNGLTNVSAVQADLHLPWPRADWNQPVYQIVLLDPARAGALGATEQVVKLKPAQILYVSCNAATFARDCKALLQGGYQLEKLCGIDMFPHTSHLELMALFSHSSHNRGNS